GASAAEAAWRAAAAREYGWLTGPEADAAGCDATFAPIVTGYVDPVALDRLVAVVLGRHDGGRTSPADPSGAAALAGTQLPAGAHLPAGTPDRLRSALLAMAADVLSGPGGLAAWLRQSLLTAPELPAGPGASPSLPLGIACPLDLGQIEPAIPPHLRRAVTSRHTHCAFPGCDQPASVCQVHHLIPRAEGGPTTLGNLVPLCTFHHLIVVHRWGWALALHPDGSTTATSPDGTRVLHSHSPPGQAA
ncbi:MAG TPA: HNH endonuclease signature motif containing protein, partial [Streptosporangiaceae bacterium]